MNVRQLIPDPVEIEPFDLPALQDGGYMLKPFDERTLGFLNDLSRRILTDGRLKTLPEMAALGFWLRRSHLKELQRAQSHLLSGERHLLSPVGKVLHICPANVDTMFLYSLVVSLLMGNRNVLRVSDRMQSDDMRLLFGKLSETMGQPENGLFRGYVNIVTYGHEKEINDDLSSRVNARVIWGGDATIQTFRSSATQPRCRDIVFADRVSAMCIGSEALLALNPEGMSGFLKDFYNDSYTFDQMGCSSPQTVFFLGEDGSNRMALERIESGLGELVKSRYTGDLFSLSSLKLNRMVDDALEGVLLRQSGNGFLRFVELSDGTNPSELHGCGGGYFYWRSIGDVDELVCLGSSKVQTLSCFGLSSVQLKSVSELAYGEGIDRIVRLGHALNFDYIWDGYNLFEQLGRRVYVQSS